MAKIKGYFLCEGPKSDDVELIKREIILDRYDSFKSIVCKPLKQNWTLPKERASPCRLDEIDKQP